MTTALFSFHGGDSLLHGAELHSHYQLGLCGHVLEHVRFQPPQHVRTKKVMELLDLVLFRDISKLFQEAFQVTDWSQKKRAKQSTIVSCLR